MPRRTVAGWLSLPPWRRAPVRLLRSPALFSAVAVVTAILVLAVASRPLFVASSAAAAHERAITEGCPFLTGLRIERDVAISNAGQPTLSSASAALARRIEAIPETAPPIVTVVGGGATIGTSESSSDSHVQLVSRDGFLQHIEILGRGNPAGIWLPDSLDLPPDDHVVMTIAGVSTVVPVAGIFRDLARQRDEHWCSMSRYFAPFQAYQPPPVVLLGRERLVDLLRDGGVRSTRAWWEYGPKVGGWDLAEARAAIPSLERVARASNDKADGLAREIGRGSASVDVVGSLGQATRAGTTVDAAAGPVALGTAGVALLMLLGAVRLWVDRRARELRSLSLRGAGPGALAAKGLAEIITPVLVGAVAGLVATLGIVERLGPGPVARVDQVSAARAAAVAVAVAVAAMFALLLGLARRVASGRTGGEERQLLWEPVALAVAGAALYELKKRRSSVIDGTDIDALLVIFPTLLVAGMSGLVARVLLARRALTAAGRHVPSAAWLALRRLSWNRRRALPVATAAAVSIGIVIFAGGLSSSLAATSRAKTLLPHGAEQVAQLDDEAGSDDVGSFPSATLVGRTTEAGVIVRGRPSVDVLAVDPATFARGAFWDRSFAGDSLSRLLDHLEPPSMDGPMPVILAAGDAVPDRLVLTLPAEDGEVDVEATVVDRVRAFPGLGYRGSSRPLVVVSTEVLGSTGAETTPELWVRDPSASLEADLRRRGVEALSVVRPTSGSGLLVVDANEWAIDYVWAIGACAGFVMLAGTGLYLGANGARRRVSDVMARQLGVPSRTRLLATALELGALLGGGVIIGAPFGRLALELVSGQLDPLPHTAPAAILRVDGSAIYACLLIAAAASLLVAGVSQRRTALASLPRILRDAG